MKVYKTIPCFFLMAALCGCTTQSIEDAKNIVETKTYAYRYEYETEQNGEAITQYHEEKPTNTDYVEDTEENILYAKANSYHDKFKHLLGTNSTITWDKFYNNLNNPKMTKKVFNDLKGSPNGDAVIMRIDGKYDKDRIYNSKDLLKIFKEKGIDGLKGFGYVTLSTITEDGDILGHSDSIFMQQNLECKKIYVYHYMDIREYILNNTDKLVEQNVKDAYYIDTIDKEVINDFLFSISTIIFNMISIIGLMFIYKLLEEDSE